MYSVHYHNNTNRGYCTRLSFTSNGFRFMLQVYNFWTIKQLMSWTCVALGGLKYQTTFLKKNYFVLSIKWIGFLAWVGKFEVITGAEMPPPIKQYISSKYSALLGNSLYCALSHTRRTSSLCSVIAAQKNYCVVDAIDFLH
jgi:hypothetical protein